MHRGINQTILPCGDEVPVEIRDSERDNFLFVFRIKSLLINVDVQKDNSVGNEINNFFVVSHHILFIFISGADRVRVH